MRNNTLFITMGILALLAIGALFLFFPREAGMVTSSIRRMVNPKHADMVRLEYMATNPALSRGWQTLRMLEKPDQCRALLSRNFANEPGIAGPIGSLRCVALRASGEVVEVLETRRLAEAQN